MALIKTKNLSYAYEDELSLKDISLSIKEGEFFGLLGANGSGKSTLALLIAALLPLQEGEICLNIDKENLRAELGILFQNAEAQFVLPVVEDEVAFGPENLGLAEEEVELRIKEVLEQSSLEGYEKRLVSTLSGGEQQRLALADFLAMKGSVLIFDESLSMLDCNGKEAMMRQIDALRGKYTIIFITHTAEELINADRIAIIDKGKLVALDSPPKILCDIALLESAGVSAPDVVYIAKALRDGGLEIAKDILTPSALAEALCHLN